MNETRSNGWTEYQRLVMNTLEQHEKKLGEIAEALTDIKVELGMLKVKAGMWGVIGGIVPMAITIALMFLKKANGID